MLLKSSIIAKFESSGFVFIPRLQSNLDTESIVSIFGEIIDVNSLFPGFNIGNVQSLIPRSRNNSLMNQYSGTYGLDEFPFHTDLAQWSTPPRYFLLRCIAGSPEVKTRILPFSSLQNHIEDSLLKNAIVCPRKPSLYGGPCALPVIFPFSENLGIRWDFLFLRPINVAAKKVYTLIEEIGSGDKHAISFTLENPGDTILIDNWKVLHGRSSVPITSKGRKIERAYFKLNPGNYNE